MPAPEPGQKWAVLGGVFDPVHRGHLSLISGIVETARLDGGLLVPALDPPHRGNMPLVPFEERAIMVELALQEYPNLAGSEVEADNPRPNYTINTMRSLRAQYPETEFLFVIGADNVSQLHSWYEWKQLLRENRLLVGCRPGSDLSDLKEFPPDRIETIRTPEINISSTEIRRRIAEGVSEAELAEWVPNRVATYIMAKGFYQ